MLGLNKIWKIISEFLGPAALILAIIFGVSQCNRANRAERSVETVTGAKIIDSKVNVDTTIDSEGNQHGTFTSTQISREVIGKIPIDSVGSEIDSLIKPYKDKIDELTIINSQLRTKNKGVRKDDKVTHEDKTIKWVFDLKTDSLDLSVNLKSNFLKYNDGTQILGFNVGSKTLYTDFWWNDSRIKINSVNSIKIENTIPKNTLNLSMGSEYRFGTKDVLIGPELELNMSKWTFSAGYLFNLSNTTYEPVIGLKYHMFK